MRDMQFVKDAVCKDEKDETDSFASKEVKALQDQSKPTIPLMGRGSLGVPGMVAGGNLKKGKFAADPHGSPIGKPPLSKAIFPVSQSMRDQIPKGDAFAYGSQGNESRDASINDGLGNSSNMGTGFGIGGGSNQEIPGKGSRPGGGRRY